MAQCQNDETAVHFAHTVVQECVYSGLPVAHRERWHTRVCQALETLYASNPGAIAARLAYHYGKADAATAAVEHSVRVAAQHQAHAEAVALLQQALQHIERLPDGPARQRHFLQSCWRLATSLQALGRVAEAHAWLMRAQARLAQYPEAVPAGRWALLFSQTAQTLSDWEQARDSAQCAVTEAALVHDVATMGQGYHLLTLASHWAEQPWLGIAYGQQAVALLQQAGHTTPLGLAYGVLALHYLAVGDCARALAAAAETIGHTVCDRHLQATAAWVTGMTHAMAGRGRAGVEACKQSLAYAPDPLTTTFAAQMPDPVELSYVMGYHHGLQASSAFPRPRAGAAGACTCGGT